MSDSSFSQDPSPAEATGPDAAVLLKTILDEDRLVILGLLAQRSHTPAELAAALPGRRTPPARHLAQLVETGLVKQEGDRYLLDTRTIQAIKRSLFARPAPPPNQSTEEQVLATYVKGGKLVQYPALVHQDRRMVILRWLAENFAPNRSYTEPEVNALLAGHSEDHATLRRYLVDVGLLERQGGVYRRGAEVTA